MRLPLTPVKLWGAAALACCASPCTATPPWEELDKAARRLVEIERQTDFYLDQISDAIQGLNGLINDHIEDEPDSDVDAAHTFDRLIKFKNLLNTWTEKLPQKISSYEARLRKAQKVVKTVHILVNKSTRNNYSVYKDHGKLEKLRSLEYRIQESQNHLKRSQVKVLRLEIAQEKVFEKLEPALVKWRILALEAILRRLDLTENYVQAQYNRFSNLRDALKYRILNLVEKNFQPSNWKEAATKTIEKVVSELKTHHTNLTRKLLPPIKQIRQSLQYLEKGLEELHSHTIPESFVPKVQNVAFRGKQVAQEGLRLSSLDDAYTQTIALLTTLNKKLNSGITKDQFADELIVLNPFGEILLADDNDKINPGSKFQNHSTSKYYGRNRMEGIINQAAKLRQIEFSRPSFLLDNQSSSPRAQVEYEASILDSSNILHHVALTTMYLFAVLTLLWFAVRSLRRRSQLQSKENVPSSGQSGIIPQLTMP